MGSKKGGSGTGITSNNCSRSSSLASRSKRTAGAEHLPFALVYVSAPTAGACSSGSSRSSHASTSLAPLSCAATSDDHRFARTDGRALGAFASLVASTSQDGTSNNGTSPDRRGHLVDHLYRFVLARLASPFWALANRLQPLSTLAERRTMDTYAPGFPTAAASLFCLNSLSVVVVLVVLIRPGSVKQCQDMLHRHCLRGDRKSVV